ncbi:hypothetical protein [Streptomyces sp. NBC_00525]|uniref:hypothetical protein n=1 Tax=Streptomyces sp. NBC_00525 TaxID=2903660 RepID=UPI002E800958|nr:hypothetical protein [Streptomyces sp. NBC_00525]WUC97943.1 hypothetical protein OG710_30185 [Streptomyces sp. NBC_00525]
MGTHIRGVEGSSGASVPWHHEGTVIRRAGGGAKVTVVDYMLLGGAGGALIEAVAFFSRLGEWRAARLTPSGGRRKNPPSFLSFIDLPPIVAIAVARLVLGGATATAFGTSGQATGGFAALTVGAAAPALLQQLGQIRQIREAVTQPMSRQRNEDTQSTSAAAPAAEAVEEGGAA